MTGNEKIAALELIEHDLCEWLDLINYIGSDEQQNTRAKHYVMIEGVKGCQKFSFSFILSGDSIYKFCVVINAKYPRPEQVLTIEQFREWMKADRHYSPLLQN